MEPGRTWTERATGIKTVVALLFTVTVLLGLANATSEVSSQADWSPADFNATSADRVDNSGDLGIGYLNGTSGDSLKGFWRFDQGLSKGYSGEDRDGTVRGGVTTGVEGVFGTEAFNFDGTDGRVTTGIDSIPSDTSLTVSAWVKPDALSGRRRVFSKDRTGNPGVTIMRYNVGTVEFYIRDSADSTWINPTASAPAAGEWTLVTGVWDRNAQEARLYIDGVLQDTVSAGFTDINSNSENITVGSASNNDQNWDGGIDEVRFYHRALSDSEIRELYFHGTDGVFNGDYNRSLNLPAGETPTNLTVTSSNINLSGNQSWAQVFYGEDNQTFKLDAGSTTRNYSLDFNGRGGELEVYFNMTADTPVLTPVIDSFKVWTESLAPIINVHSPVNDTVSDNTPWLNVTSPDSVQEWKYSLDGGANESFTPNETLNPLGDGFHSIKVWAESTDGYWNSTIRYFTVNTEAPNWRDQGQETDSIPETGSVELYAQGYDLVNLTEATLATNETGAWQNKTGFYGSPATVNAEDAWTWTNFTWQNTSVSGNTVAWKIWYRGSEGEYNSTDTQTFSVGSVDTIKPEITITKPLNTTLSDFTPWLNVTSDEDISIWSYNLDSSGNLSFQPNITLGPLETGQHEIIVWGNDTADNWNFDQVYFYVDNRTPNWNSFGDNSSGAVTEGQEVNITAELQDADSGLYRAYLSTNETGTWQNYSGTYGSPEIFQNTTSKRLVDFTWDNIGFSGVLGYRVWFRDAAGNWNSTPENSFLVEEQTNVQSSDISDLSAWTGVFNYTSVTRQDNSGNLGIGYMNYTLAPIGFWRLDTDSGAAKDYSGNGFNGAVAGATRTSGGVFSTDHFYFSGSGYVDADISEVAKPDWTVSVWIKPDSWNNGAREEFLSFSEDVSSKPLDLGIENGQLKHWRGDAAGQVMSYDVSGLSGWHHVTLTQDRTSSSNVDLAMYVDGNQVATASGDYENLYDKLWIGASKTTNFYFSGGVDEAMLFNKSLDQGEIDQLYFGGKDGVFNGDYNQTVDVPDSGRLTRMLVDYENAASSGNQSWIEVETTNGETQTVKLSGTQRRNYTLNFTQNGGQAFVNVNFTASTPEKTPIINELELHSESLTYSFNTTLKDSSGSIYSDARLEFLDSFGNTVASADTSTENYLEKGLARDLNYTVRNTAPVFSSFFIATLKDITVDSAKEVEPQVVRNYTGSTPAGVTNVTTVYALDDTGLDYSGAKLVLPKLGTDPNVVLHCTDWDFGAASCNSWQVNSTSEYGAKQNSTHIWFEVDRFDAFGVGKGATLPNVTDIRIYEVTDLVDKETGGRLVDTGLNTTLDIGHNEGDQYRFEFRIRNQGDGDWDIENSDELFHDGLNTGWPVTKIWYNISGDFDGGSTSSGRVNWDTSNGGVLQTIENNNTMYAKYIVNITDTVSNSYSQQFKVNDTSSATGSEDYHLLNVTKLGFLDVELTEPPSSTTVCKNDDFTVNATVNCRDGLCGDVYASTRYNESGSAETLIPENSGTPFHTLGPNTRLGNNSMKEGDSFYINWSVNATGSIRDYLLDVNASSMREGMQPNNSDDALISLRKALYTNFQADRVDFGVLDPGERNISAAGNSNHEYNLSVGGCATADTWIRSTDLATDGWGDYSIDAENVSYGLENDISNETDLSGTYDLLQPDVSSNTNLTTFYWIDVPTGIKSSDYNGTLFFKVNATG